MGFLDGQQAALNSVRVVGPGFVLRVTLLEVFDQRDRLLAVILTLQERGQLEVGRHHQRQIVNLLGLLDDFLVA